MKVHIAAVIAAAGLSSRMGRFKPLLPFGGQSAVEKVIGALAGADIDPIIVVGGHRFEDLATVVAGTAAQCSYHPRYREGMFSSFKHGIRALPNHIHAFFAHPVDVPLISTDIVRRMISAFEASPDLGVYPCFNGRRGRPVLIPGDLREEILSAHDAGGLRMTLERHAERFQCIEAHHPGILLDMDTTADYRRLKALNEKMPPHA